MRLGALCLVLVIGIGCAGPPSERSSTLGVDVVVYGGTASGLVAALEVARLGRSVVILEPSQHLGGLTTGGLGATDVGNADAIGGQAREFYRRVRRYYERPEAWRQETRAEFLRRARNTVHSDVQFAFEPHVASALFESWLLEEGLEPIRGVELATVEKDGPRLVAVTLVDGRRYRAQMFIDATYEGDLLAAAGVSFAVGRESNATFGESLNGVQTAHAVHHQFVRDVDPWIIAGDPRSGLLPGIDAEPPGLDGAGDDGVQAYCFRLCTTDDPKNRLPWLRPEGYHERDYELLLRNFEAGDERLPWSPRPMPNRKTDTNNNFAISTDFIGQSHEYPNGDRATRARIVDAHRNYQQGLLWTLAHHPRVPESVRLHFQTWGLARDEFVEHDHWSPQIYVREARRLIGEVMMTEAHCRGSVRVADPVALAAYTMDSHHVHRYVTAEGVVRNEGDVQVRVPAPFGISYRALTPQRSEAVNLLVPVCLSASHIAFGSIRMEPVFMALGQASGAAAVLAIEGETTVQGVPYERLRSTLVAGGQRVGMPLPGHSVESLEGIVIDDEAALREGAWSPSTSVAGFVARGYRHDGNAGDGEARAVFEASVLVSGRYVVRFAYTAHGNRATNIPVEVRAGESRFSTRVDERRAPDIDGLWVELGAVEAKAGDRIAVHVSNTGTDGHVVIDAVQLLRR